jgi:hypothetical protein
MNELDEQFRNSNFLSYETFFGQYAKASAKVSYKWIIQGTDMSVEGAGETAANRIDSEAYTFKRVHNIAFVRHLNRDIDDVDVEKGLQTLQFYRYKFFTFWDDSSEEQTIPYTQFLMNNWNRVYPDAKEVREVYFFNTAAGTTYTDCYFTFLYTDNSSESFRVVGQEMEAFWNLYVSAHPNTTVTPNIWDGRVVYPFGAIEPSVILRAGMICYHQDKYGTTLLNPAQKVIRITIPSSYTNSSDYATPAKRTPTLQCNEYRPYDKARYDKLFQLGVSDIDE